MPLFFARAAHSRALARRADDRYEEAPILSADQVDDLFTAFCAKLHLQPGLVLLIMQGLLTDAYLCGIDRLAVHASFRNYHACTLGRVEKVAAAA